MSSTSRLKQLFSKKKSDQVLGLSFSEQSLAVCALNQQASHLNLSDLRASYQTESQDDSSRQNMPKPTFMMFDALVNQYEVAINKLENTELKGQCSIALNASQAQIVQIDKPSVPENEIKSALVWQVKDQVTIAPEDMLVDYFDGLTVSGGQEKIHVVCASKKQLSGIVAGLAQMGSQVTQIISEEFAFTNLIADQQEPVLLVCQQPNEEALILIVKDGQLCFYRRLRGFKALAQKSEQEISDTYVDMLSLEIQRSSDYYERQLKQASIRDIRILLPIENEAFLARKLAENANAPVNLLDLGPFNEQRVYAAALGAALMRTEESND